jgi:hypothetical protein
MTRKAMKMRKRIRKRVTPTSPKRTTTATKLLL